MAVASLYDDNHWCEANYGLLYLTHTAADHIPYCDARSFQSGVECSQTLQKDLLCVLSGVQYMASAANNLIAAAQDIQHGLQKAQSQREKIEGSKEERGIEAMATF